ncbi:MAG: YjbQ family protein [Elusimicrobia bacterium]|nr:YjbQ family protein [Elusimicrobiota bacterium]
MVIKTGAIKFKTKGSLDIVDITGELHKIVKRSDVLDGIVNVFIPGATGAITAIELESGLIEDFKEFLKRIIPEDYPYKHNLSHADRNGHSHVRASLLGPSITIPVRDGALVLGTWQNIVFIEMDNRPRSRSLVATVIGHGRAY